MFIQVCNIRGNLGVRFAYNRLQYIKIPNIQEKITEKKENLTYQSTL